MNMSLLDMPMLDIQPRALKFLVDQKKRSSCVVQLTNTTHHYVAYKVKTTAPNKYYVRPNVGVVAPKSFFEVTVDMQAFKETPPDMVSKDKFLIQSTVVPAGITHEDIKASFSKVEGKHMEETKLRVTLVSPSDSPELFKLVEEIEEMKMKVNALESKLKQADSTISKLMEERSISSQHRQSLQQELGEVKTKKIVKEVHIRFPLLLDIQPRTLKFLVDLKKQSSCVVQLTNTTHHYVAFKVKTTSPNKYCVYPNVGVVAPKSSFEFTVDMQAFKEPPPDMVCNDKFLIQSTVVPAETTHEDIKASVFSKVEGKHIEKSKLKVTLVSPSDSLMGKLMKHLIEKFLFCYYNRRVYKRLDKH